MKLRQLLLAGAGALSLGVLSLPASAAPSVGIDLRANAAETSPIENVAHRRCWQLFVRAAR